MQLAALTGTAQHFIQAFSWMLIHSLWQGLLLAIVTGAILMSTKKTRAVVRYNLVFVQFALFITACGATFIYEWNKPLLHTVIPGLAQVKANCSALLQGIDVGGIGHFARTCMDYFTANAPFIVLLWFVLFLFRAVRVMKGLVFIHHAKNRLVFQPSDEWAATVNLLCRRLQLKRAVRLLESGFVKVPMVIGWLKPVILIPIGLLAGLPAGQVEAVLLHELAHIRRNDYVVNFVQTMAEAVFFFNPGLLWISCLLRDERENCCDDMALEQTRNKREFIEALISFKEHSLYAANYQVAFPGNRNHLLNRVSRILSNQNKALAPVEKVFFMAGVIALSVMVATTTIAGMHTTVRNHTKPVTAVSTDTPVKKAAPANAVKTGMIKRKAHLLKLHTNAALVQSPATPQTIGPTGGTDNLQNKLKAYKAVLPANTDAQTGLQSTQEQKTEDREQVKRNAVQAIRNQQQGHLNEEQAKRNREQEKRNAEQADRNKHQAEMNELQAKKNAEQALLNQEQNIRNQAQAVKNQEQAARNQAHI